MSPTHSSSSAAGHLCWTIAGLLVACTGCAQKAGIIFPPLATPLVWPAPPDPPRIAYVGQLLTSADLKPPKSGMEALGEAILGRGHIFSMLSPYALCTDGQERLFVADSGAQAVHVFDLRTRKYALWSPPPPEKGQAPVRITQPVGVAWDPAGRLLVADSVAGALFIFDAQGAYLGQLGAGELKRPAGICIDPKAHRILVADVLAHQVVVFSLDGKLIQRLGGRGAQPGQFNFPTNLALDSAGRLYVSDSLNFRIQQFDPDLQPLLVIGGLGDVPGTFAQPKGIAVDADDHLYVVDSRFENVQIFDSAGRLLLAFGEEGAGRGQFWLPAGICIDQYNRIFLADTYNRRVQVFEYRRETSPEETAPPATRETKP